jgi:hypothetical protein
VEHDQHATTDRPHAAIQGLNARQCPVILQQDIVDCIVRHNRSDTQTGKNASLGRVLASKSKLRSPWIRFTVLPEQHELDAYWFFGLLRHDLAFDADRPLPETMSQAEAFNRDRATKGNAFL